jgi:uncharacterized phage protein (TIGR01671 family)
MREIKFRAWDKNVDVMLPNVTVYPSNDGSKIDHVGFPETYYEKYYGHLDETESNTSDLDEMDGWIWLLSNFEIMQFTGLLDAKGKEIYEGDILNLPGMNTLHEVAFHQGSFNTGFKKRSGNNYTDIGIDTTTRLEIIGNVYENPELLK